MINYNMQHAHTAEFLRSFDSQSQIANAVILDSGCGDGFAAQQFIRFGAKHVDAHDPNARLPESTNKITYKKNYVIINDVYDIIWSHHVIEHIENPIDYLQTLRLQLHRDGELWLGCPNTLGSESWSDGHINNFNIGNLLQCLQRAEFGITIIKWLINPGQIRIRIPKLGNDRLPTSVALLYNQDKHFKINKLPHKQGW